MTLEARLSRCGFSQKLRETSGPRGCAHLRGHYVARRRGTEPQRARPPRCEAAPPSRSAKSEPGKVPQVARNRVDYVQARGCRAHSSRPVLSGLSPP
jgi:hypothetical protein